jgi:hypothetical protein
MEVSLYAENEDSWGWKYRETLVILNFRVLWDSKVWPPQILDLDGDNIFADRRSIVSQATK